jgi:hypothetical protein
MTNNNEFSSCKKNVYEIELECTRAAMRMCRREDENVEYITDYNVLILFNHPVSNAVSLDCRWRSECSVQMLKVTLNALNKQSRIAEEWAKCGVRGLKALYHKKNALLLNVIKTFHFIIA